jgi:hypothetical protein
MVGDSQGPHRTRKFSRSDLAERVVPICGSVRQLGHRNLSFFAASAGDDADLITRCNMVRDGASGGDRLVVRMGMDEEERSPHPSTS